MYEKFFGLTSRPFSKTPDPRFLFLSAGHEEALARLQYAVEEKELILFTGNVGCGKTTLTRTLMDSLGDKYRVILLINPRLNPTQLLRTIARRFGMHVPDNYNDSLLDAIFERVYEDYEAGITPVIIIDESQLIPDVETFEEIRLITNFQLDDTNLLSLVLVGQPDLRDRLNLPEYEPLRQRIGLFYHIGPLKEYEIKGYVEHRVSIAGRTDMLFTDQAIKAMYFYSEGVPRVLNSLATTALLEGFCIGRNRIDEDIVAAGAKEIGLDRYRGN